jgi:hypothetical protein
MKYIFRTCVVIALLVTSTSLFAASDYYLKLDGVKGEAKGKTFTLQIDQDGNAKGTNLPPGDYNVKMCATGTHIKSAKLFVRKQGTEQHDYYTVDISSFSWGVSQTGFKGGVRVAAGDVNGDGRADIITGATAGNTAASGGGGGAGKVSYSDLSFSMKTSDGKTKKYGGGGSSGKVQFQDFHFTMKPAPSRGNDMFEGQVGTVSLVGPSDSQQSGNSFFDIFIEID